MVVVGCFHQREKYSQTSRCGPAGQPGAGWAFLAAAWAEAFRLLRSIRVQGAPNGCCVWAEQVQVRRLCCRGTQFAAPSAACTAGPLRIAIAAAAVVSPSR